MEFPKRYESKEVELKWKDKWYKDNIYKFDTDNLSKPIYMIDTPPPTVSGRMHLGHAFGSSQQDFIARYKRLKGYNVLQPFGTDDNGLPSQRLVEKIKKVKSQKMKREDFVKLCNETLDNELRPPFLEDWKRIGLSADFNIFYSTINDHSRKVSQKSFLELYKKGKEYRMDAPTMWCPVCQTAVSQVELEDVDQKSYFNDIIFKVQMEDGSEKEVIIATTRPELLCACVAVFVNPEDERYLDLIGKKIKTPLYDTEVTIIADERVEIDKGTGLVMCCTFGDQTDIEWYKAYNLPLKSAITKNGIMTSLAGKYEGLRIVEARKEIIEDLKKEGFLVNQKKITHAVNVHERCGTPIEILKSKQWFIKYMNLKEELKAMADEMVWHPKHMKHRFKNWADNLQWDWCISRQIHFGIPFPVWYCKDCDETILADESQLPVDPLNSKPNMDMCPKCGCKEFIPEKDIINTWATSSLTPDIVKELLKDTPIYNIIKDRPMDLRPQGHDIITFWLFNTVVKSLMHHNRIPFKHCYINGWMLDPKGKKMSKSKGNAIAPQDILEKYSADALRFMAASAKLGDDLAYPEKDIVAGKKFVNKLWNATKFVNMNLDGKPETVEHHDHLSLIDKWLFSKWYQTLKYATEKLDEYNYQQAKMVMDKFFYQVFCDNYLEIVKDKFFNPSKYSDEDLKSLKYTTYTITFAFLRAFSIITPFVTEEIYQIMFKEYEKVKSIHNTDWPKYNEKEISLYLDSLYDNMLDIISAVRKFKGENKKSLKTPIKLYVETEDKELEKIYNDLKGVCKAENIENKKDCKIKVNDKIKIDIEFIE